MHPNSPDIDTTSIKYQYYDQDLFDEYERENQNGDKENQFQRTFGSNSKYEVIGGGNSDQDNDQSADKLTVQQLKDALAGYRLSDEDKAAISKANKDQLIDLYNKYNA